MDWDEWKEEREKEMDEWFFNMMIDKDDDVMVFGVEDVNNLVEVVE